MARTIRVFWQSQKSGWKKFYWHDIDDKSVIYIAACEGEPFEEGRFDKEGRVDILNSIQRKWGAAAIFVKNVHPFVDKDRGGGVEFLLQIDWDHPLHIVTDITVIGPADVGSFSLVKDQP